MELNQNNFIADMMRFASSEEAPDNIINNILQYICENLHSDRAYIFEDNLDGTYDNTYEYCSEGVNPEIENLKNVPYENMLDAWINEYNNSHNILIYDIEEYKNVSEPLYELLKPQGINTLVTGPIKINGKYIGFYGVDNPPVEIMHNISDLLGMMEFVMCMMIRIRNYMRTIENSSMIDSLTGCKNRKALEWAYNNEFGKATSLSVLMCDLNGLKQKNDCEGHEAGDRYICQAADALAHCFGKDNIYRLGGDEFVVIKLSEQLDDIKRSIEIFAEECNRQKISVSFGLEYHSPIDDAFEHILHDADTKMYNAKKKYYENNTLP